MTNDRWYPAPAVCLDLDGTLIEDAHPAFGPTRPGMKELADRLGARYWIIVSSSRPPMDAHRVEAMLAERHIHFDQVTCGVKPPADIYFDDRGLLADPAVLYELAVWKIDGTVPWLDGLAASSSPFAANIQAHGDGGTDPNFRVVVPVTGGMDSLTLWSMAREAGVAYELVYLRFGQDYADAELAAVADLIDEPVEVLWCGRKWAAKEDSWVIPGRNALILTRLAEWMGERGWWGEVWFGNTNGESPTVGGDKSRRFLNQMQTLLCCAGFDVRLCSPLIGFDKTDIVRWWQTRDIDRLARTKSCFHPTLRACGRCVACFRKYVAFRAAGFDAAWCVALFDQDLDFADQVSYYGPRLADGIWQGLGYSPSRRTDTLAVLAELKEV